MQKLVSDHMELEKLRTLEQQLKNQSEITEKALRELESVKLLSNKDIAEKQMKIELLERQLAEAKVNATKLPVETSGNPVAGVCFKKLLL